MAEPSVLTSSRRCGFIAQSWWIASELVRRHPHLRLIETHPGGGQYDCLTVVDHRGQEPVQIVQLNRQGRMHVVEMAEPLRWHDALAADGGHDVVRRLEQQAGLVAPKVAPPSAGAVLSYRLIARVLAALVNDRHSWDARNGQIDSSGGAWGQRSELGAFPSVVEALRERLPDDILSCPAYRFWLLLRGD